MHDLTSPWMSTWNYENPAAAYLFLLIPLFALFAWWGWVRRQQNLEAFGKAKIRRESNTTHHASRIIWRIVLLSLASVWTILALMNPFEEMPAKNSTNKQATSMRMDQEIWLLLDFSASMGVGDEADGETRFDVAKRTATELLRLLPGRPIRLYTFTSRTDLAIPLTWDRLFVELTLQNLSLDPAHPGGTDFATLFETLNQAHAKERFFANTALILLTDGGDTAWEVAKGEQQQARLRILRDKLPQDHTALFGVAFGSAKGGIVPGVTYEGKSVRSVVDATLMESLIRSDRLFFSSVHSPYQLAKELKEALDHTLSYDTVQQERPVSTIKEPRFALPLLFAIFSLLAALAIPGIPTHRPLPRAADYA